MDSQYSEENSMESHTEDDDSITTKERDENSSEDEQSSITTENSSEEEIDPWTTLINDAASKVRDQYEDILQALLMEGHDESEAKEEAFEKILPVFQKELADVYMNNLAWMKALRKDPIHKKIMATRDDYVQGRRNWGGRRGSCPPCLFLGGARGAKVPFKNKEYYINSFRGAFS